MDGVARIYEKHCATQTAITPHLPRLRGIASGLEVAMEFGVKRGASSSALLMGAARVISYDVASTAEARELKRVAGERWSYRIADSTLAAPEPVDLLFVDSQHDYRTCKAELERHADQVRRFLVFHDVGTFGEIGARGESGEHAWRYVKGQSCPPEALGIRPAIDELMIRDHSWRIIMRKTDSHGLLVLERR